MSFGLFLFQLSEESGASQFSLLLAIASILRDRRDHSTVSSKLNRLGDEPDAWSNVDALRRAFRAG
jgi:hypothetical protein